jgi:hypothetical protein
MRMFVITLFVSVLPGWAAAAEQAGQPRKPPSQSTLRPAKGNPCAEFGPGFVRVEGSSTCVKVGGSVNVEAGSSVPR